MLLAEGLSAGFGASAILSGISFSLEPGQCMAVLGPNGSGKSTLLKSLMGIGPWRKGRVELGGSALDGWDARQLAQRVAYVPQEELPAFPFTVRDTVLMGRLPRSRGLFETEADLAAAERAMAQAQCGQLALRKVTELSGGELQRVLLARALAQEPRVLLLDEPNSHMDASHAWGLAELVCSLKAEGMMVLMAVHDLNLARRLSESVLILKAGRMAAFGAAGALIPSPELEAALDARLRTAGDRDGWLMPDWPAVPNSNAPKTP